MPDSRTMHRCTAPESGGWATYAPPFLLLLLLLIDSFIHGPLLLITEGQHSDQSAAVVAADTREVRYIHSGLAKDR